MVIPIGQLKSGNHHAVQHTVHAVASVAHHHGTLFKVILETAMLSVEEKLRGAELAIQAGADFIKTSTGFGGGGATAADVALMRGVAGGRCGVKASGGIRTLADVKTMLEAGANRIDGAAAGLGAGAGNTPLEVFVAVCERMGIETGVDVWKIQDVAEDLVVPMMDFPIRIDRDALTLGYAGVYGSFLLFAKRAGEKYGIPARDILVELGRRGMVGGQEDMIEDTALTLAKARAAQPKREAA